MRIGIIGCGGIGRTHMQAWLNTGVRPVAVCDQVSDLATQLARVCDAAVYTDAETLFQQANLDIVSICTPPALHASLSITALQHGIHVLCEKPMAITTDECHAMIAAAQAAKRILSVGFCHRFQPHIEVMKSMVDTGVIGDVIMFHNRFIGHMPHPEQRWFSDPVLAGGGVMVDTCVHSVDLFRHLIGDARTVQAQAVTRNTALGPALRVEDTAVITLVSTTGIIGVIEASWRTPPGEWVVSINGTAGQLHMDYATMQLTHTNADGQRVLVAVDDADRFTREVAHMQACVAGQATPRVTMYDGLAACDILQRAARSAHHKE